MLNHHTSLAERAQALALLKYEININSVITYTGFSRSYLYEMRKKARDRGFNPSISFILKDEYLTDAPRSGRPLKATPELVAKLLSLITRDRYGREKTTAQLASELGVAKQTTGRALKRKGYKKCKPKKKPGLTAKMKLARLQFAIEHKNWTLNDWKRVIWTDEASVILGQRRGNVQVWRTVAEGRNPQLAPATIRNRWKGSSEFMFWGSFCYDRKGMFDPSIVEKKTD